VRIEKSMTSAEPADVAKLQAVYTALASERGLPIRLARRCPPEEIAASKLFTKPKDGDPLRRLHSAWPTLYASRPPPSTVRGSGFFDHRQREFCGTIRPIGQEGVP